MWGGREGNWRPVQISMEEKELAINQLQHLPLCPSQVSTPSETDIVLGSCFFWLAPLQILAWLVPFLPVALSWNIQSQRWLCRSLRSLFIPLSVIIGLPQKFDWVCYKILWEKNKLLSQPNIFFHNTYYGPKSSYCGLVSFLIVPSRDYNIGVESGRTDMKICLWKVH